MLYQWSSYAYILILEKPIGIFYDDDILPHYSYANNMAFQQEEKYMTLVTLPRLSREDRENPPADLKVFSKSAKTFSRPP